jgi:FkbM family methyltransferase
MKKFKVSDREGWLWPDNDTACWDWLQAELDSPEQISKYCKNTEVVVQAGGNCGLFIKSYASLFDTVYTFEPDPKNFYCLVNNVLEENVIKIQACLGNSRKLVGLKIKKYNAGVTRVGSESGIVPTLLVDDLCLEKCDLIHFDIEGYEFFALEGAINTIKKHKPVIAIEWLNYGRLYDVSQETILSWLADLGYKEVGKVYSDAIFVFSEN